MLNALLHIYYYPYKIKHHHYCCTSFPPLHNGCVLEKVIMKMYRLNFYYQITEQLHYKIIEKKTQIERKAWCKAGVQVEVGSMKVILGAVCMLAALSRFSYLPLLSLLGLVISQLSYSSSFLRCFPSFPLSGDEAQWNL